MYISICKKNNSTRITVRILLIRKVTRLSTALSIYSGIKVKMLLYCQSTLHAIKIFNNHFFKRQKLEMKAIWCNYTKYDTFTQFKKCGSN